MDTSAKSWKDWEGDGEEQLPPDDSDPRCRHVQAEDVAAPLLRCLTVQPTLDHDEEAGEAEANRRPQG